MSLTYEIDVKNSFVKIFAKFVLTRLPVQVQLDISMN